ncbi:MAG: DegT/DnrJ/EryC1/StrS family aminotransferase, partial [Acetobacteraceae bacterium]|nr:DegT/DnrJ/EryC1/StrS family aminotransferase [Acetobacteraceae bacterium]
QYGWRTHYVSEDVGVNSRLDELQAAILRVKLQYLDAQNARRAAIAAMFDAALAHSSLAPPAWRPEATHVFHLYVVRTRSREAVQARLRAEGIGSGIHYPQPVHLQPAYRGRVALGPSRCARTEIAAAEVLSLPLFPELADTDVNRICAVLRRL